MGLCKGGTRPAAASAKRGKEGRPDIWSVSSKTLGFYLVLFWAQCVAGIALTIRREALARADGDLSEAFLDSLSAIGPIGFGAAVTSLTLSLTLEAILVLAQIIKQRQYDKGVEIGREEGIEEGVGIGRVEGREEGRVEGIEEGVEIGVNRARRDHNAKIQAWAKQRGIPADELPELGDSPEPDEPPPAR